MNTPTFKTVLLAVALVLAATGFAGWGVYATFIAGTTGGQDFIEAVRAGIVRSNTISSIEVVEPMIGSAPSTAEEYDRLKRRGRIDSVVTIGQLMSTLVGAQPGQIRLNHPVDTKLAYLKVNTENGFFWIYCKVLRDANGSVLVLDANRRNATNPNGASRYHLMKFSEVLAILEGSNHAEPAGNPSKLKVGDRVKIVRIPPEVERDQSRFPETFAIFQNAVGRAFQIRGFGDYGHAELWLRPDGSEDGTGGKHSIWVEPARLAAM